MAVYSLRLSHPPKYSPFWLEPGSGHADQVDQSLVSPAALGLDNSKYAPPRLVERVKTVL